MSFGKRYIAELSLGRSKGGPSALPNGRPCVASRGTIPRIDVNLYEFWQTPLRSDTE